MAPTKRISRQEKRLAEAVADINNGSRTVRAAAVAARVPATTLFRRAKAASSAKAADPSRYGTSPAGRRPDITAEEESRVVDLIREQSVLGHPMRRSDVADAVVIIVQAMLKSPKSPKIPIIVQAMPRERRAKLRFKNGVPARSSWQVSLSAMRPKSG
jgi:hypothetical protein